VRAPQLLRGRGGVAREHALLSPTATSISPRAVQHHASHGGKRGGVHRRRPSASCAPWPRCSTLI